MSSNISVEEIEKIVNGLSKIDFSKISKRPQTYFDIFGVSYKELAVSNVLAYFIERSDYKDLFLNAFSELLNLFADDDKIESIDREVSTFEKKRIDLVIKTTKYVIGIENKIFANDKQQPYNSYKKYLKEKYKKDCEEKNIKLILLSIFQDESKSEYKEYIDCCIKYDALIKKIKEGIGSYFAVNNADDYFLLKNFINNMENIMNSVKDLNEEEKKLIKFMLENGEKIKKSEDFLASYKKQIMEEFYEQIANFYNEYKYEGKSDGVTLVINNRKIFLGLWLDGTVESKKYETKINSNLVIIGIPKEYEINKEKFYYYSGNYNYLRFDSCENYIEEKIYNKTEFLKEATGKTKSLIEEFIKNEKEIFM